MREGGWVRAFLLVQSEFPALDVLCSCLEATRSMLDRLLLLPIIVSEIVTNFALQFIQKCDEIFDELERQAGQHGCVNEPKTADKILGLDFTKITPIRNIVSTVLGRIERSLKSTLHTL